MVKTVEPKMIDQLWYLTVKNFKSMIREIRQLIWIFGYPLVFILLLRFGYGLEVYNAFAPGLIILGPIVLISQLAGHFAEEKELGTLQRLITTPVSRHTVLLSGLFSQLIVAAIQIIVMLFLTFLFGASFNPNANLFLLFFIPFVVAFTSLGFGLLLASFVNSASSAGGLAWFIILPLQFLGGLLTSPITLPFLDYLPTSLGRLAMGAVMLEGSLAFNLVGLRLILLATWGIGLIFIGILLFQRKTAIF
jgi:ABC-2 type transport system permease protein